MAPNISARDHIRWLPNEPTEPTSTIVLTSGESRFVDIRILIEEKEHSSDQGVLLSERLEWAFAGTSSTEVINDVLHSTWHHTIDSKSTSPEDMTDEGDMIPQPDGRTLEKGSMVNPDTKKVTHYEEMWRDVKPLPTGDDEKCHCVVLQLTDDKRHTRGMVIRIDQYCQGLLRVDDEIALERWEWQRGGWNRDARIGRLFVPCGVTFETGKLKVGGTVKHGDYEWEVVEMSEF